MRLCRMTTRSAQGLADEQGVSGAAALSDLEALGRFADSADAAAFDVIVSRYRDMVLGTCVRQLRNFADAEDATQETFLKLAQNARTVQSNAAAWLHATAVRTCIDLQRRGSARASAVRRAADEQRGTGHGPDGSSGSTGAGGGDAQSWREIEPLVDAALGELSEADRDLIIARFMGGRSQAELAREAGVNAGTISRRIDAALARLREHLAAKGVGVSAVALSGALVFGASSAKASPQLIASLASVPATGSGASSVAASGASVAQPVAAKAGLSATAWMAIALASAVGVASVAGVVIAGRSQGWFGGVASSQAASSGGFAQPTVATPPARLVKIVGREAGVRFFHFDGTMASFLFIQPQNVGTRQKPGGIELELLQCDAPAEGTRGPAAIRARVKELRLGPTDYTEMKVGQTLEGTWRVSADGSVLVIDWAGGEGGGATQQVASRVPEITLDSVGLPEPRAEGNHPLLTGLWNACNDLGLVIDGESITIRGGDGGQWVGERYGILSWTDMGDHVRVETICKAQAFATPAIGKRIKLLLRRDADGYTMVQHDFPAVPQGGSSRSQGYSAQELARLDTFPPVSAFDASRAAVGGAPSYRVQRFVNKLP